MLGCPPSLGGNEVIEWREGDVVQSHVRDALFHWSQKGGIEKAETAVRVSVLERANRCRAEGSILTPFWDIGGR